MEHHEPGTLLATAEIIHWVALAIMAIVYTPASPEGRARRRGRSTRWETC